MIESRCGLSCGQCSYRETMSCPGCVNVVNPFWGECRVKNCCEEKKADHCGACPELPCDALKEFSYDPEHGDHGARIERCGKWAKETADRQLIVRAEEIIKASATATIALVDDRGYPRASSISSIKTDGMKTAYFSTGLQSGKVRCLQNSNKASLCYRDGSNNVTLIGSIEVLTDEFSKREMWLDWFINHFPGGVDDPNYCILRFTTERAVFWVDSIGREFSDIEIAAAIAG